MLDLRVVGHRVRQGDGRPPRQLFERDVERPLRRTEIDRGESEQGPGEERYVEQTGAGEPGRAHESDQLVGNERLVEHRVLALRRPHAEGVPRVRRSLRPEVLRGTKPWTICGAAGSDTSMAWNPPNVHTGVRLPKIL